MEEKLNVIAHWKEQGLRIVFTNGVFDILHVGHVTYLQAAKKLGDRLVVGLNSDESVRRLNKGPERPIHSEGDRQLVLEALSSVDAVIVFNDDTPAALIQQVGPHVLVKGGDYDPMCTDVNDASYIVGSDWVREHHGIVQVIPLVKGHSTTEIIKKSRTQ